MRIAEHVYGQNPNVAAGLPVCRQSLCSLNLELVVRPSFQEFCHFSFTRVPLTEPMAPLPRTPAQQSTEGTSEKELGSEMTEAMSRAMSAIT